MNKLEQVLGYKEKTIVDVLGVPRPTIEQVLGLEPVMSHNITPPEPEPIVSKPTIVDRIKKVKDKIFKKMD